MSAWLLPDSIADVLPSEARRIEELRRKLLDRFRTYGYELVMPPMLEYVESLLSGTGHDLDLKTFKLIDQISGRTMALRADTTPQVARIDAHLLNRKGITRLCYCGSVVHTKPAGMLSTREPLQCGAELYGYSGVEADIEILRLAVDALNLAGVTQFRIDLCHADILAALLDGSGLGKGQEALLHQALVAKDRPSLSALLQGVPAEATKAILALTGLYGPALGASSVLERAKSELPVLPKIVAALASLQRLAQTVSEQYPDVEVMADLADLHGYEYHSGMMFSAYAQGSANALMRGGRYDNVGELFGRPRPATGFSTDLRELVQFAPLAQGKSLAIRAQWNEDRGLEAEVRRLRDLGEIVVQILPGSEREEEEFECDRELVSTPNGWLVQPLAFR